MRYRYPLAASLMLSTLATGASLAQTSLHTTLLPMPQSVQAAVGGNYSVRPGATLVLTGGSSPRIQAAALRAMKRVEDISGTPMPRFVSTGSAEGTITLKISSDGEPVQGLDENESYRLTSSASGVLIEAPTTVGALHALETMIQLLQRTPQGYVIPAVTIQDSPRFRWRGLMIDCGRHFEPLDVLKRNIDAMAAVKLNVFHWHLTEDQGFRIESKLYPKLTELGSDGKFYTQADARELVSYARARGIRVVPEFEMPGHSAAWLMAYPELSSGTKPNGIRREFGVSDTALDATREETYRFIKKFLGEMATIFPDQYVHIGGDETPAPDWKTNPRILSFMKTHNLKDNEALQAYFNHRILGILSGLHKRMVGWDEIFNPSLPKDVVVQSWRGEASLAKGAEQGYQGVLSAPYYLDGMRPAGVHYLADPVPATTQLTPEQQKLILGGEVCMWAEHLDERTIDSRIWPRTAAIAERFWSAQSQTDVDDMYRRLQATSIELESLGLHHLSSEDAGLRSLAGSSQIDALRTFAQAFQPVSFGERYQQQHTSQLTPLTGFVDAVVPDPPVRHWMDQTVKQFLLELGSPQSREAGEKLKSFFQAELDALPRVRAEIAQSPRLEPMSVRATQLEELSHKALDMIAMLETQRHPSVSWNADTQKLLDEAKKPSAIVSFVFQQHLESLFTATIK